MTRFTEAELQRIREKPISELIGQYVEWDRAKTQAARGDFWACCPFHAEKSPSFHCEDSKGTYKCFGCGASGDHFRFLQLIQGLSFVEAVEALGGEAEAAPLSPAQVEADKRDRAAKLKKREDDAKYFREEERKKAYAFWGSGGRVAKTEGAEYMRGRGLLPMPVALPIRFNPHFSYWHQRPVEGRKKHEPFVLFSGPVLMVPITWPDGRFCGVHITFIDPASPGKKISFVDEYAEPRDDGRSVFVAPKKIRGTTRRAAIRLHTPKGFTRLVIGEGWETTASVLVAEYGSEQFARTAYWSSISLQHMGGKAVSTINHPTLKNKANRPVKVPGPEPDLSDDSALLLPDQVREVVRLGDGDSDRFTATQVHARAAARWVRPDLRDKTVWAPDGLDMNDILQMGLESA